MGEWVGLGSNPRANKAPSKKESASFLSEQPS